MSKKSLVALAALLLGSINSAWASDEPHPACQTLAAAAGVLAFSPLMSASLSLRVNAVIGGTGAAFGHAYWSSKCQDAANAIENRMLIIGQGIDPLSYQEYLENYCGGDPAGCSDPLLSMGDPLSGSPEGCAPFLVNCEVALLLQGMPAGFSAQDLVNSMTFLEISRNHGSWQVSTYGHLIGIQNDPTPPPGSWDMQ